MRSWDGIGQSPSGCGRASQVDQVNAMSEYRIISTDDHVFEPADIWTERLESKYRDRAPRIQRLDDGNDWWVCNEARLCFLQGGTQVGLRFEEPEKIKFGDRYDNIRPGGYIPEERIKDMDMDGVDVSVVYPSCGLSLYTIPDTGFLNALFVAYHEWLAEYCGVAPDRLKPIAMLSLDDLDWDIRELERCHKMGFVGAMIPCYMDPSRPYQSREYDRLWAAAQDLGMPLSLHIATNRAGLGDHIVELIDLLQADAAPNVDYWVRMSLSQFILGGVFERFSGLQIGSVEHEASWAPHFLDRLDYTYTQRATDLFNRPGWSRYKTNMLPSDYFHQNVFISFQEDALGIRDRHIIGVDNLQWGSDYPHAESTFPRSHQILDQILEDCTEDEKAKITSGNGARIYHLN